MKRLSRKFWFLTAALGLLLTMSTLVTVAGNHQVLEESPTELVDVFEEVEAITSRSQRPPLGKKASQFLSLSAPSRSEVQILSRFDSPASERDRLNGIGGYLRT